MPEGHGVRPAGNIPCAMALFGRGSRESALQTQGICLIQLKEHIVNINNINTIVGVIKII